MSDAGTLQRGDSVTFRIDPTLKAELTGLAEQHHLSLGELLREMVRERVERERRLAFAAEAQRQCLEAAAVARDARTDEHQVMRELEADLDEFGNEWR
jgi:predicted transcriptional regulator